MSRHAWLTIELESTVPATLILASLMTAGWSANYFGHISYLPLGDKDEYDWAYVPYSSEELEHVMNIIRKKQKVAEVVGIVLYLFEEDAGVDLLLQGSEILVSCSIHRRTLPLAQHDITDASWYIERIVAALPKDVAIRSIRFEQV